MAIELPRTGGGSVTRGRGRRTLRLPSSADVPSVRVPAPGVPDPGSSGIGDVGDVVQDMGVRFAQADERINKRRESVDRIRRSKDLMKFGNELLTDFSSSRDLSLREDAEEFGATLNRKAEDLVSDHEGSEESKLRLRERFLPILQGFSDKGAIAGIAAQEALIEQEFSELANSLSARVRQGENPELLIAEGLANMEAERDALRPGQEVAFERTLTSRVYGAKVDDFLAKGEFDEAEEILDIPRVRAAIGQEGQRRAFDRISAARRQGSARILTPGETNALGFPEGVIVQKKGDGSFDVVFKPTRDPTERSKKIADIERQLIANGAEEEEAKNRAVNIVDGNIRIEVVAGLGVVREVNEVDSTAREVPLSTGEAPAAAAPQPKRTLFEMANSGAIAGIVPAFQDFMGRTVGQIPGVPVATDVIEARQDVKVAQNELIRALSINPRFPVGEINRIRDEIKIEPAIVDSRRALLSRMIGVKKSLRVRLANEEAGAADVNLPQSARSDAARAARDIRNFLERLGAPDVLDESQLPPEGIPEFSNRVGVTRDGKDVWESPDGKRWVID